MGGVFGRDVTLSWFCDLPLSGQVALLMDPRRPLSPGGARRIADSLGEQMLSQEVPGNGPRRWRLAEPAARQLGSVRKKLDKWWNSDSLTNIERNYLIAHRADDEPPPHAMTVELPVLRAYLEMKARAAPPL